MSWRSAGAAGARAARSGGPTGRAARRWRGVVPGRRDRASPRGHGHGLRVMRPARSASWTSGATASRRSVLATAARVRPTWCATCSWVSSNSSMRRRNARASSSALRSDRWRFSTSARASWSCSSAVRMTAGMVVSPARFEARSRRSPAMSRSPSGVSVRSTGCRTPWRAMLCARASMSSSGT